MLPTISVKFAFVHSIGLALERRGQVGVASPQGQSMHGARFKRRGGQCLPAGGTCMPYWLPKREPWILILFQVVSFCHVAPDAREWRRGSARFCIASCLLLGCSSGGCWGASWVA